MGVELSQFYDLLAKRTDPIEVGRLPIEVAQHISASLRNVYLSNYSLVHIMQDHPDVTFMDLLIITPMLADGLWIAERKPNMACVSYVHPETGIRYIGAVKCAAGGFEVYLSTFHRSRKRQTTSLLKRGPILQSHK